MNKGLLIQYYHRSCRWRQAEPCYVNQHAVSVCYNDDEVMDVNMTIDFYIILAAIVLLTAVMLIAVHRINKRAIN